MQSQRFMILLLLATLAIAGCGESWDIGHTQTLHHGGWNIRLVGISDDSVTQSDWGTTVSTGGHTIVISNGVTADGGTIATGASGDLKIVRGNGTVTVTINGRKIDLT
jgi:hypothetical protein